MKVTNPTESALEVQYRGVVYRVAAGESIEVPEEAAMYWKTMIHSFISLGEGKAVPSVTPEVAVEKPVEVVETVEEVVTETPAIEEQVETVAAKKTAKK